jgi:hypothetical protein
MLPPVGSNVRIYSELILEPPENNTNYFCATAIQGGGGGAGNVASSYNLILHEMTN